MDVISLCPLRASALFWQPQPGACSLTVICKATYQLLPGESRLAPDQEYPNDDENHWDDDPDRSLYSPSDLVPFKSRADVLLVGHAFAPHGGPARSIVARLASGVVDKSIEVFGERFWAPDGGLREGQPFVRMPLRYERAAGGPDTENPVGMRLDGPIPNLQPIGAALSRRGDRIAPVGFGPIASRWPPRIGKLGPHADLFRRGTWHAQPLPDDLDASFFNAAPSDQQTDHITADASLVLENLNAQHPLLITKLPGLQPRSFVELEEEGLTELPLTGDTLWIDTDRSLCTVVWRGLLPLRDRLEKGRVYVLLEEPGRPLSRAEIERRCGVPPPEASSPAHAGPDPSLARARPSDNETQQLAGERQRRNPRPGQRDPDLPFTKKVHHDESDPTGRIDLSGIAGVDAAPRWLAAPPPPVPPAPVALAPVALAPVPPAPVPPPLMSSPALHGAGHTVGTAWVLDPTPPAPAGSAIPALVTMGPQPTPSAGAARPPAHEPLLSSVLSVSNAAVAAAPWSATPTAEPEAAAASQPSQAPEVVDLLWFDPAMLERIRGHAIWRGLLEALEPRPPEIRYDDEAPPPEEPQEVKDRRDVFFVLTEAEPTGEGALDDVFMGAVGPMGALRPPLALVVGELQLPFDELETLKATVAAVAPLAAGDKKIKEIVDTVNELLKTPWLEGSSGVAEGLTMRVREAFAQSGSRLLQAGYLEAHTERRLLEQRHYQRRTVLGRPWIRGLLTLPGATAPIPTYLPADLATILPMFRRFKARLVAEVHLQQDQYESHPHALRAVTLARVAPAGKGRR